MHPLTHYPPTHALTDECALVLHTWIRHYAYSYTYVNIQGPSHHIHPPCSYSTSQTFGGLQHHADVFNTFMISKSECLAHTSTISEYCITCPRIKHQCTSEYLTHTMPVLRCILEQPSQMYRSLSLHVPNVSGTLHHVSEYYPLPKHAYSEYSPLFTHITQTAYRIFKDLRIFPISLPQHSRHIGTHLRRFLLRETMHRHILRYSSSPHQSGLFIRTF